MPGSFFAVLIKLDKLLVDNKLVNSPMHSIIIFNSKTSRVFISDKKAIPSNMLLMLAIFNDEYFKVKDPPISDPIKLPT